MICCFGCASCRWARVFTTENAQKPARASTRSQNMDRPAPQQVLRGRSSRKTIPGCDFIGTGSLRGGTASPQYLQVVAVVAMVSAHAGQGRDMVSPHVAHCVAAGSALALQNGQASIMVTSSGY